MSLVYVKNKKNGVTYVYESSGFWDKNKQQARHNGCQEKKRPAPCKRGLCYGR